MPISSLVVRIAADVDDFEQNIAGVERSLQRAGRNIEAATSKTEGALGKFAQALGGTDTAAKNVEATSRRMSGTLSAETSAWLAKQDAIWKSVKAEQDAEMAARTLAEQTGVATSRTEAFAAALGLSTSGLLTAGGALTGFLAVGAAELLFLKDSVQLYIEKSGILAKHQVEIDNVKKAWEDMKYGVGAALVGNNVDFQFWLRGIETGINTLGGILAGFVGKFSSDLRFVADTLLRISSYIPGASGVLQGAAVFGVSAGSGPRTPFVPTQFNPRDTPGGGLGMDWGNGRDTITGAADEVGRVVKAAMDKAKAATDAHRESVIKLRDEYSGARLQADVRLVADALRELQKENTDTPEALRRVGEAAERLRQDGARLSPELLTLAVRTEAFSGWLNKVPGQTERWATSFDTLRTALEPARVALDGVDLALAQIALQRGDAFGAMRDTLGGTLEPLADVDVALRQIKEAQKGLFDELGTSFANAMSALETGGLKGLGTFAIQWARQFANDFAAETGRILGPKVQAALSAGGNLASGIGGALGGSTGANIAGIAAGLGGAAIAATGWGTAMAAAGIAGSIALAGATLGIGLAAVGIYKLITYTTEYEKRVRENNKALAELRAHAIEAAGSFDHLRQMAQLAAPHLLLEIDTTDARHLQVVLAELDVAFSDLKSRIAETWGALAEGAAGSGVLLDASLAPFIAQLRDVGAITDDLAAKLLGMTTDNSMNWREMQSLAEKYGIELSGLGATFQQQKLTETASDIIRDFDRLINNGADFNAVLHGMTDEIQGVVLESLKFGTEIPGNMRPWIEALIASGGLLDGNKSKITDINTLKFGPVIKSDVDKLVEAIRELIDKIGTGLPAAIRNLAHVNVPTIKVPVELEWDDGGPRRSPSATGLASGGIVRRPTFAFLGEAGPEAVVPLSQMGHIAPEGGEMTVIFEVAGERIARATVPYLPGEIRRFVSA